MTREEQLGFCRKCKNREFDSKQGLICKLSSKPADFEDNCKDFTLDETVNDLKITEQKEQTILKIRGYQDFYYAIIGGVLATLIGAVIWAAITVATGYQIGYMSIAIGLLVGYSIQFFGAGIDAKFGFLGAGLSLLACLTGNLLSQVGFYAESESISYIEVISYLDLNTIINVLTDTFSPMDIIFYGIAIFEGYKFAFRKITKYEMEQINSGNYSGQPENYKLRLPLVVISIIILTIVAFKVGRGYSGHKIYYYESGAKNAEGEILHNKESGKWTFWNENGKLQSEGYFDDGLMDSLWIWYDESQNIFKSGNYKRDLENGVWIFYYANGNKSDSGSFINGRENGIWKYWYENGNLGETGEMIRSKKNGLWEKYYQNGTIMSKGKYKNDNKTGIWFYYNQDGTIKDKIKHIEDEKDRIIYSVDIDGSNIVSDGNGTFKTYFENGNIASQGTIADSIMVGKWISFYDNGNIKEEGTYEDEIYYVTTYRTIDGKFLVENGNGNIIEYYSDKKSIFTSGQIKDGLKSGIWKIYMESPNRVYLESNYSEGKLNGTNTFYNLSGNIELTGNWIDDNRDGEWIWYHDNGNISSTATFKNGKKDGVQSFFSETGNKTKEEYYEEGNLVDEDIY